MRLLYLLFMEMKKEKSGYKIIRNKRTKGLSCFFEVGWVWYFADLSYCRDVRENEMMVFRAKNNEEVVNRSDLYCKNFDSVSKENLVTWIEEFKKRKEKDVLKLEQRLIDNLKKMWFEERYCDMRQYKWVTIDMDLMKLLDASKEDLIWFALKNMAQAIENQLEAEEWKEDYENIEKEFDEYRMLN